MLNEKFILISIKFIILFLDSELPWIFKITFMFTKLIKHEQSQDNQERNTSIECKYNITVCGVIYIFCKSIYLVNSLEINLIVIPKLILNLKSNSFLNKTKINDYALLIHPNIIEEIDYISINII